MQPSHHTSELNTTPSERSVSALQPEQSGHSGIGRNTRFAPEWSDSDDDELIEAPQHFQSQTPSRRSQELPTRRSHDLSSRRPQELPTRRSQELPTRRSQEWASMSSTHSPTAAHSGYSLPSRFAIPASPFPNQPLPPSYSMPSSGRARRASALGPCSPYSYQALSVSDSLCPPATMHGQGALGPCSPHASQSALQGEGSRSMGRARRASAMAMMVTAEGGLTHAGEEVVGRWGGGGLEEEEQVLLAQDDTAWHVPGITIMPQPSSPGGSAWHVPGTTIMQPSSPGCTTRLSSTHTNPLAEDPDLIDADDEDDNEDDDEGEGVAWHVHGNQLFTAQLQLPPAIITTTVISPPATTEGAGGTPRVAVEAAAPAPAPGLLTFMIYAVLLAVSVGPLLFVAICSALVQWGLRVLSWAVTALVGGGGGEGSGKIAGGAVGAAGGGGGGKGVQGVRSTHQHHQHMY